MVTNFYKGHPIQIKSNKWIYSDTKQKVESNINRKCGYCKIPNNKKGHDACLGELKGLMNACCGHGNIEQMYIQFLDGFSLSGENAKIIINVLKKY
ncbi:hypothetical protein LCGC14_2443020 [marine sediment metagenome]|uniref:Uncharacterized protein n=1 Tax=marine sediment metagenome TaxID=412755 RepID=A0A0F9BIM0_9ZZZZ